MPPFTLERQIVNPLEYRRKTSLYCKKSYGPLVKVSGWEASQTSQPTDNNPFNPKCYNLHSSHYNHFGTSSDMKWSTTTGDMLKEVLMKETDLLLTPNYPLVNIYTCIGEPTGQVQSICSSPKSHSYLTTMQHAYQPPYPYILRRLAMPETPHLQNRRMASIGGCQFSDDEYNLHNQRLQANKASRFVSYNPCTGRYTDGSSGNEEIENKCVDINKFL
ncbi:hypothetical protein JTB14_032074 [Gonioctena quinquepunctata]|nr:hypothetical protein JTB14_032074 [Gonioctena quinquepunctata]